MNHGARPRAFGPLAAAIGALLRDIARSDVVLSPALMPAKAETNRHRQQETASFEMNVSCVWPKAKFIKLWVSGVFI
jgi:hypothetical protein